jgi:hypothetical protein
MIQIETIPLDDVLKYDRKRYNTNNHWHKDTGRPENYDKVLGQCDTLNWIDLFHEDYKTFIINRKHLKWIYEAFQIGQITAKLSHSFDEDLENFLKENADLEKELFTDPNGYFIRSEGVSLKYGKHGAGPYHNLKEVIESIVTTTSTHKCIDETNKECKLYLMKYLKDFKDPRTLEFRIFIHLGKITAISQQQLYTVNTFLVNLGNEEIKKIVVTILDYFENKIKCKINYLNSYVMDFALLGPLRTPYFIEINSFGKEYASGSALFGWIQDLDILYGTDEKIVFRYTV